MTHETLTSSQLSMRTAALRMVDLPLSVYSSLTQVRMLFNVLLAAIRISTLHGLQEWIIYSLHIRPFILELYIDYSLSFDLYCHSFFIFILFISVVRNISIKRNTLWEDMELPCLSFSFKTWWDEPAAVSVYMWTSTTCLSSLVVQLKASCDGEILSSSASFLANAFQSMLVLKKLMQTSFPELKVLIKTIYVELLKQVKNDFCYIYKNVK